MRNIDRDRWRRHLSQPGSLTVVTATYPTRRIDLVYFPEGAATLPRPYRTALLARIRRLGPEGPRTRILIRGFANPGGGSTASHSLALRRAMAVADALYEAGVPRRQVRICGPEVLGTDPKQRLAQRSYNRRVELLFQPGQLAGGSHRRGGTGAADIESRGPRAFGAIKPRRMQNKHASLS